VYIRMCMYIIIWCVCISNGNFLWDPILSWQDLMKVGVFSCGLIEVGLGAGNLCCNWHSSFENWGLTPSQVTLVHKLL